LSLELASTSSCPALVDIFYLANPKQDCMNHALLGENDDNKQVPLHASYTFNLMYQGRGMQDIVASTWRHDEELGRGYILFSQSHHNGRVWRWEVGGGPIAIGRTLHLESSGCRSNEINKCHEKDDNTPPHAIVGSGGMAIDFHQGQGDKYSEGALVVAEWGEGRIVRMEESNGARTPLVVQVPDICRHNNIADSTTSSKDAPPPLRRLHQPRSLLYAPFGDLLVADTLPDCQRAAIFHLSQAVHVEALESLAVSRKAHSWNETRHVHPVTVFYQNNIQEIGGMAMDPTWLNMYVTVKDQDGRILLIRLPAVLEKEDYDDDDDKSGQSSSDDDEDKTKKEELVATKDEDEVVDPEVQDTSPEKLGGLMDDKARVVMDMTQKLGLSETGPLVVSEKGHIFVAVPKGVAILSVSSGNGSEAPTATLLGYLPTPEPPTSLTLGEDKFLYAFSSDSLYRIRINVGPVAVPTNLVVGKRQEK